MIGASNSMENEEKQGLNTWVEVIDVKQLKQSVIEENPELRDFNGLVLKKIHKSNLSISYEKIEGGFAEFLEKKLQNASNMQKFIDTAKPKFC